MKAWYFSREDRRLRYDDDRPIAAGAVHTVSGDLKLCLNGLHASKNILDALNFAPGPIMWRVELGGEILAGDNKLCASERRYLWGYDATAVLRHFARLCALDVIDQWDATPVVVEFLKTGNPKLAMSAARDAERAAGAERDVTGDAAWAARAAAGGVAWDAAGAAAGAARGARAAARAAVWDAAWAAERAARAAAWDAAKAAVWDAQSSRLYRMIMKGRTA